MEREHSKVTVPTRPHSTHIQGYAMAAYSNPSVLHEVSPLANEAPSGTSMPTMKDAAHVSPPSSNSPLKVTPDPITSTTNIPAGSQPLPPPPDGGAPPSLASAPDTKLPRESKEPKLKESLSTSATGISTFGGGGGGEKDPRGRKASEPPPSLQALFSRDSLGSSRRWANRQFSAEDAHVKQHSFDSSHLQHSPKLYARRVKSPSVSDKNSRVHEVPHGMENIHRTPSHPHLNSATSSPQVSRSPSSVQQQQQQQQQQQRGLDEQPAMPHSRSTQQLTSKDDKPPPPPPAAQQQNWIAKTSSAGSSGSAMVTDPLAQHAEAPPPSGLKLMKDREMSMSKESLTEPGGGVGGGGGGGGGMKRTASRESLKGGGGGGGGGGGKDTTSFPKVIQAPPKEGSGLTGGSSLSMLTGTGSLSARELNKENRERSAPSKDTQSSAEGSVENMQAPLFQQVRTIHRCHITPHDLS